MNKIFFRVIKTIFLFIFLLNINFSFAEVDYSNLDKKIEKVQNKILNSDRNINKKIRIFEILIKKLNKIEKKGQMQGISPTRLELINYINKRFTNKLLEFKTENNLINKLNFSSEIWEITDFKISNFEFIIWDKNYFILREFTQNNLKKYLIVEDKTYNTFIIKAENIKEKNLFCKEYNNSGYKSNLDLVYKNRSIKKNKNYLQNAWLKSWLKLWEKNIYLTADFCPSGKHWFEDKAIEKFIKKWNKNIGIAITSAWINWHKKDFQQLIEYKNSWKLNITWINHTKTHKYNYSNNFSTTFILTPWLILKDEIMDVEKKLIENSQIPSIFMRFPGLISNEKIYKEVVYKYWLIPLGSDTWLAKWEKIKPNSIILIHWNKNEPRWIEIFNKNLDKKNDLYYNKINNILK